MKKILAILICVCLLCVSSFSCFAAIDLAQAKAEAEVSEVEGETSVFDKAMDVISVIQFEGAVTNEEILEGADNLYNDTFIDKDVYDEIYRIVESGMLDADPEIDPGENEDIFNEITEILNDDTLSLTEKISKIANILKGLPAEEIESILNDLNAAGILDDETYTAISNAINGDNSILGGNDTEDGSPISGIKDLLSGILGMLGIGGGSDDNNNNNSGNNASKPDATSTDSTKNPDSSKFEGEGTKTGDYALVSVAGVALAAGAALILTKVKKNENDD